MRLTRSSRRLNASTVRPPSTVSLTVPASCAYDARSQRYPAGARFRYQRVPTRSTGAPTMHGSAAIGLTQTAATTVRNVVTAATSVSGNGEAHGSSESVDVCGRSRHEVAGAGPFHGRERKREHALHEVLPQLGEHLLGENERGEAREERQDRLGDQRHREENHERVDVAGWSCRPARTERASRAGAGRRALL